MLRHEVDSIECLSPYGVAASSKHIVQPHMQSYLAYVVVREGIAAVCHVFKAANRDARDNALKTIESALYADVKCYKVILSANLKLSQLKPVAKEIHHDLHFHSSFVLFSQFCSASSVPVPSR